MSEEYDNSKYLSGDALKNKVAIELTHLLFAGAFKPNVFVIISSFIISFALRSVVPLWALTAWSSIMIVFAGGSLFICHLYNKAKDSEQPNPKFTMFYLMATGFTGIGWSLLAFLPGVFSSIYSQALILVISACVIFLGISVLAMNRLAQIVYITPLSLALTFNTLMFCQHRCLELALLCIMFLFFMLWMGKQYHQRVIHNLTLQCLNEELIADLKDSNKRVLAANEAKSNFLANMSHELRTPMNGIVGMTQLALKTELTNEQQHYLKIIKMSSDALLHIINDILDFSKIEAGKIVLESRPFAVGKTVREVIEILKPLAEKKDLDLSFEIDSDIPAMILGDSHRLGQILFNLMGNGIKFTRDGEVKLKVDLVKKDDDELKLCFTITDTGIGIGRDTQDKIFDSFAQADITTTRKFGGTGLGLSISREICRLMGGDIKVTSTPGKGSIFYFTIVSPIVRSTKMPEKSKPASVDTAHSSLTILLVEDNDVNRELGHLVLSNQGHVVKTACNGKKGLEKIADMDFDLILMDIQMPEMDGFTATKIIRSLETGNNSNKEISIELEKKLSLRLKNSHLPIIAITAHVMSEDREKCLAAGMDEYLTKPLVPEDVAAVISQLDI